MAAGGSYLTNRPSLGSGPVAVQHTWINPQLTGHGPYCRRRSGGHVVRAEPRSIRSPHSCNDQPRRFSSPWRRRTSARSGPLSVKNRSKDSGSSSAGNPDSCSRWASDRNRTGIRRLYDRRYGAARPTIALVSSPLMLLPDDVVSVVNAGQVHIRWIFRQDCWHPLTERPSTRGLPAVGTQPGPPAWHASRRAISSASRRSGTPSRYRRIRCNHRTSLGPDPHLCRPRTAPCPCDNGDTPARRSNPFATSPHRYWLLVINFLQSSGAWR